MANLGKLWAGSVYGTNTGKLAISFEKDGEELEGVIRVNDDQHGLVVYQVHGEYGDEILLTGTTTTVREGVEFGQLTVKAVLTPEGSLRGAWSTTTGTGGPFIAYPHDVTKPANSGRAELEVEQFYTQSYTLGALNLSREDILSLMEITKKDFNAGGRLIVTYRNGGAEVTKYHKDFIAQMDGLNKLNYLKLFIQEPDEFGVNKIAIVELADHGANKIVVQGVREIWVEGKALTLQGELMKRKRSLATNFKEFGVNLSQLALFVMIIVMVDIESVWIRVGVGGVFLALIKFVEWLHVAFIPNASIHLGSNSDTWLTRWRDSIFSWVSTIAASAIASLIVYYVTLP